MKKLLTIMISLFVLSLSFSLKSQVNRAGTIIKIYGNEITVRNENPSKPFAMGENLRLLTGDKSVVLQVTFAMQSSAKCKLISGKIGSLKIGSLVYSGGIPENSGDSEVKEVERKNIKSMKIDDFQTFLGLTNGDTMEKAVQILGKPTEITIADGSENSRNLYDWKIENNCSISVSSNNLSTNQNIIEIVYVFSCFYKFDNDVIKSFYLDTTTQGTVHYLHSKGINDKTLYLFGLSPQEIVKIFGNPLRIYRPDDNSIYSYWYETSTKKAIGFSFSPDEDKMYFMTVYLN